MTDYEALFHAARENPEILPILGDFLEEKGETMLLTNYFTGEVTESTPGRTVLRDPAWIPDTGRLSEALKTGTLTEVEPGPEGESLILNTSHITNGWVWNHPLPRSVK